MPSTATAARARPRGDASRRLEALAEISHLITLGLDAQAILEHTVQATARLLDSPYARMWVLDDDTEDLILAATAGELSSAERVGLRRPRDLNAINHSILARGELYQTSDIESEPYWHNPKLRTKDLGSYLGVPLLVGEKRYGLLSLRFRGHRVLGPEDIELVRAVAAQAAAALHNARAYEQSQRQSERLATLAEISRLVTSSLEPQAVLEAAAQATARLLGIEQVVVWLYDPALDRFIMGAREPRDDLRRNATLSAEGSMAGDALRAGEPLVVGRLTEHPHWQNVLGRTDKLTCGMFVPFFGQDAPLGVISLVSTRERDFDAGDIQLVQGLAAHVAFAIQNARLYEDTRTQARKLALLLEEEQERRQQLEAIRNVADEITRELDLTTLLRLISDRAVRLVGAAGGALCLWDETSELLVPKTWHGVGDWIADARFSLDVGIMGKSAASRQGMILNDYRNSPLAHPLILARTSFTAVLTEPILYQDRVIGTIVVAHETPERVFTSHDQRLLRIFAGQAAIAIENARLFDQEQQRRDQLEAIRRVTADLTQELDLTALLGLITGRTLGLVGVKHATISLWDEERQLLVPRLTGSESEWAIGYTWKLGEGVTGIAAQSRKGVINNSYQPSGRGPVNAPGGLSAVMAAPIVFQDHLVGAITVSNRGTDHRFTEQELDVLRIFADQAAIAIENARLFEQAGTAEALAELARLKTEFLSTVSHELRTPLSLIHGYSELLASRADRLAANEVAEMAAEIQTGSRTMARLVDDLLDFSRIEQGRLQLHRRSVVISDLLERQVESFRCQPGGARIQAKLAPGIEANVDPERLAQVVNNLLANSLRYAPKGPITLRARRHEGGLRVEVVDRGPGIPADEQTRVWEKFYRGSQAMHSVSRGSGLGLAVVQHLVELHGGRVGVQSTPGRGTKFWFTIPLRD